MNLRSNSRLAVAIAGALALGACSSGSDSGTSVGGNGSAQLSVSLMDGPVDDVTAVYVEITGLWLKAQDGGPAEELPMTESPMTVNLLGLTEENAALLVDGATIEPGAYEWLRMDVNAEIDGVTDSYAITKTGEWREIRVPSGSVRLVDGFEAVPNEALELIFDWDLRKGLVHPPGLGRPDATAYILKPAFRVIDTAAYGRLSGSIPVDAVMDEANDCNLDDATDMNVDVGNAVYVYAGHDVVPDDFDAEMDVEPLLAIDAELNDDSTAYEYSTLLDFGEYTVAFTCQAANDDPETDETGNEMPEDDTVTFFSPTANITLADMAGETSAVVDFPVAAP